MTQKIRLALQWRDDVHYGEMVEAHGYRRSYLSFDTPTSQKELNAICEAANTFYRKMDSNLLIGNHMEELMPGIEI